MKVDFHHKTGCNETRKCRVMTTCVSYQYQMVHILFNICSKKYNYLIFQISLDGLFSTKYKLDQLSNSFHLIHKEVKNVMILGSQISSALYGIIVWYLKVSIFPLHNIISFSRIILQSSYYLFSNLNPRGYDLVYKSTSNIPNISLPMKIFRLLFGI